MLYNCLKILHIISAALLLTSIIYCYKLWREDSTTTQDSIQAQTWKIIFPCAFFQLLTGFTIISIQHYELNAMWIKGSVFGFLLLISSWLGFLFFGKQRQVSAFLLNACFATLGCMIFFMANKI